MILGSEASRKFGKNLEFWGNVVQVELRAERFFVRENIYVYWNESTPVNNCEYSCFSFSYLRKCIKCEIKS